MTIRTKTIAAAALLGALAACSDNDFAPSFAGEAGQQLDTGVFGNATLNNQLVQSACGSGIAGSGVAGGKLSGGTADPVVVQDPAFTTTTPVYRVYCQGLLHGKYARVIFSEYVGSATQKSEVGQVTAAGGGGGGGGGGGEG